MSLIEGDCLKMLVSIDNKSSWACVTSPPYYGLRDYESAGQIGQEKSPEEYIEKMVEVFGLVRDVLRDDGTLWLNLGDCYGPGKQLRGIPWRVALALQADGWYLRQDIVWHKSNPMPESVTDRCTKSHEYVFLLSKSEQYYFDMDSIKERSANLGVTKIKFGGHKYGDSDEKEHQTKSGNEYTDSGMRHKRSVWTLATQNYPGAHFATFPTALVRPCVLAGTPPGGRVLDPFFGTGTVGEVAEMEGRQWTGIEINPEYCEIARERTRQRGLFSGS